jgi:hypothetical protein
VSDGQGIEPLLQRALLVYNARALHANGEAAEHASAFVNAVADGLVAVVTDCGDPVQSELVAEAYRCLSIAADNPLRQSCRQREDLVDIACHALAQALLAGPRGRAGEEEVHDFLAERWTASLLAWSTIFPAALDTVSRPCACGALGTRPALTAAVVNGEPVLP